MQPSYNDRHKGNPAHLGVMGGCQSLNCSWLLDCLMFKVALVALLGLTSLAACAQQPAAAPESAATKPSAASSSAQWRASLGEPGEVPPQIAEAVQKLNENLVVDYITPAPFAGFYEVITAGQVLYISEDGRYLMQGTPYDIVNQRAVPSERLTAYKQQALSSIAEAERIVFAAADEKHTIRVFTDTTCGFCRRLHQDMNELNQLGITVEYLAFPRGGPGSPGFDTMVSIWCADDRNAAMTAAKAGEEIEAKTCDNPVQAHYQLGQQVGVNGTPAVFAEDGSQLGGYMPPAQLRAALDGLVAGGSR